MATTASAVINTTDTATNTPTVPDASATTKWQEYIWVRHLAGDDASNKAKFYVWNPSITSVTDGLKTLKWQEVTAAVAFSDITGTATIAQLPTGITVSNLSIDGAITNTHLAGGITNSNLAGSIIYDKITSVNASALTSVSGSKIPVNTIPTLTNANVDTVLGAASVDYDKLHITDGTIPGAKIKDSLVWDQISSVKAETISLGHLPPARLEYMFERNHPTRAAGAATSGVVNLHTMLGSDPFEGVIRVVGAVNSTELAIVLPHPSTSAYLGKSAKLAIYRGGSGVGASGVGKVTIKVCNSGTDSSSIETDKKIVHRNLLVAEAEVLPSQTQAAAVDKKIIVNLMCESVSTDSGGGQWVVTHHGERDEIGSIKTYKGKIIGDGSTARFTLQHSLGTYNIITSIRRPTDPYRGSDAANPPTAANPADLDALWNSSAAGGYSWTYHDLGHSGDVVVSTCDVNADLSLNYASFEFNSTGVSEVPQNGDVYLVTIIGIV